jgi:sarcosine oxidase subunit beta
MESSHTSRRVVVIGAGALGLSTAVHVQRLGVRDVTVVEAQHLAAGSSGVSVGIIETQYFDELDIELRARSMPFFDELEQDRGLRVTHNGYLRPVHDPSLVEVLERSVKIQRQLGVLDARVLTPREVASLAPAMRVDDIVAALWGPHDGYIDGHQYCEGMAELVRGGGGRIMPGVKVESGVTRPDGIRLTTDHGQIDADVVVNAAGPWGAVVGHALGAPIPVIPQRHQAVTVLLQRALGYIMPCVVDYSPGSGRPGLYFRHEAADKLVAGLHSEELVVDAADPDEFQHTADWEFLERIAEEFADRLPAIADARFVSGWAGLYPVTPDRLPIVGASQAGRVVTACGAGGSGIQLSPILGALAAEYAVHGQVRTFPELARKLDIDRFSAGGSV